MATLGSAAQGDKQLRARADALFAEERYAEALSLYSQLVSLAPGDRQLNYRFGTCVLHGGGDREKAIGFLKYAVDDPAIPAPAWYWLGRAYHLNYRFSDALNAYQRFRGTGDAKAIAALPVDALEDQCRNGQQLLSSIKEITVHSKVEVPDAEFFRYYELEGIGGRIVVTPEELWSPLDRKFKGRSLIHLPDRPGPIYYSSYGKDGRNGRDIYRTELLPDGSFAAPVRLAGFINTPQDEDFPFMHPDGRTFYFASKGHNSMGGYDIFKSTYDQGLDLFSRPENLDFAVNTPDDDLFYIVDGEGRQACFASARSSRQDMLHVYRVSTEQVPVVLTVLKGTFASAFDAADRKAHIVVEDGLTRELLVDVRTDMDGTYLLSLPRAGRYRFVVEAGPTGRTHSAMVEVPRADGPRAYRQELALENRGGQEELVVRNFFEDDLGGDLVAMALDEIRRRARLDVGTVAAPTEDAITGGIDRMMDAAGFAGDRSAAGVVQDLRAEAVRTTERADRLRNASGSAFARADEDLEEAERGAAEAQNLVQRAGQSSDTLEHDRLMRQAAGARARAEAASARARAAMRAGQDLDVERITAVQRAQRLEDVSTSLQADLQRPPSDATLKLLNEAAALEAVKKGPDARPALEDRARRDVTEAELQASRALAAARAKSSEESELRDHIARMERDLATTRSTGAREDLRRAIAESGEQLREVGAEVRKADARARSAEAEAALMRDRARIVNELSTAPVAANTMARDTAAVAAIVGRIARIGERIGAIPIDERFIGVEDAVPTGPADDAFQVERPAQEGGVPATRNGVEPVPLPGASQAGEALRPVGVAVVASPPGGTRPDTAAASQLAAAELAGLPTPAQIRDAELPGEDAEPAEVAPELQVTPEQQRFVLENELAELLQVQAALRDRKEREQLAQRIGQVRGRLDSLAMTQQATSVVQQGGADEGSADEVLLTGTAMPFDVALSDEGLVELLTPGYAADVARAQRIADSVQRSVVLDGLRELLLDSIEIQIRRQQFLLGREPGRSSEVRPRMDRLQSLQRQVEPQFDGRPLAGGGGDDTPITEAPPVPVTQQEPPSRYIDSADLGAPAYARRIDVRSPAVADAIALRDKDLAAMAALDDRINALEAGLDTAQGERYDVLRKEVVRAMDDRLILSSDIGQRMGFVVREELKVGRDSLAALSVEVQRSGLPAEEPALVLSARLEEESRSAALTGDRLRKEAARAEDILLRDSLYRAAYEAELRALAALDGAITAKAYSISDVVVPGEPVTSALIEQRLFGAEEDSVRRGQVPDAAADRALEEPVAPARPYAGAAVPVDTAVAVAGPDVRIVSPAAGVVPPVTPMAEEGGDVPNVPSADAADSLVVTDQVASEVADLSDREPASVKVDAPPSKDAVSRSGQPPVPPSDAAMGDGAGQESLPGSASDSLPALDPEGRERFTTFLANDSAAVDAPLQLLAQDEVEISERSVYMTKLAAEQDRGATALEARAAMIRDKAATASEQERPVLEREALRVQVIADSMRQASLRSAGKARALGEQARIVSEAKAFADQVKAYYYLSSEEHLLVLDDEDHSRYFQARVKAMEQEFAASRAEEEAERLRGNVVALEREAEALEVRRGDAPEAVARIRMASLRTQALELAMRRDSLLAQARRLKASSQSEQREAQLALQRMGPEAARRVLDLEQRTRREQPLMAEVRTGQVPGPVVAPPTSTARSEQPSTLQPRTIPAPPAGPGLEVTADPLAGDRFELPPADAPATAIPLDRPLPPGLVYAVQIGAFRDPVRAEAFRDLAPVNGERVTSGLIRYTAGLFTGFAAADAAKVTIRGRGYRDAFVVAFYNGRRIPIAEARRLAGVVDAAVVGAPATPAAPPVAEVAAPVAVPLPPRVEPAVPAPAAVGVPPLPAQQAPTPAQVLATYPATVEEVLAGFAPAVDATAYYNDPAAAPARQVEAVQGLFFTVQVGVYSRPVSLDKLFNVSPLNTEAIAGGRIRYTTGVYRDIDVARVRRDDAVGRGVKDAFITAYLNGRRIPIAEARIVLERFGTQVLVDPAMATP